MIQHCFALPYYVYCLQLRCLVSFLFYSTILSVLILGLVCCLFCKGFGLGGFWGFWGVLLGLEPLPLLFEGLGDGFLFFGGGVHSLG
ncbi:Uncharacterised protein [Neisseria animalis]|nr:Uncharacterised protein [Neisseria animalis]